MSSLRKMSEPSERVSFELLLVLRDGRKLRMRPKFGGNSRQRQKGFLEFLPDSSISIRAPSRDSLTFPGAPPFRGARCNSNSVNSGDFSKFH